jgi:hypothetical protein
MQLNGATQGAVALHDDPDPRGEQASVMQTVFIAQFASTSHEVKQMLPLHW